MSLAGQIKKASAKSRHHIRRSVQYALHTGKLLRRAKDVAGRGKWLDWFEASEFRFSESMAQRYMRIHRRWDEIQQLAASNDGVELETMTFSVALQLLSARRQNVLALPKAAKSLSHKHEPDKPTSNSVPMERDLKSH